MKYVILMDGTDIPSGYEEYIIVDHAFVKAVEWCELNHVHYSFLQRNWDNHSLPLEIDYLEQVQREVIMYAMKILNQYHDQEYSFEQWNIMLADWLVWYISSLYDKYLKIKKIHELNEMCVCNIRTSDKLIVPLDKMEYTIHYADLDLYLYEYGKLLELMPDGENLLIEANAISNDYKINDIHPVQSFGWKVKLLKKVYHAFQFLSKRRDVVSITDQYGYIPQKIKIKAMLKKPGLISGYIYNYKDSRYRLLKEVDYAFRMSEKGDAEYSIDEFTCIVQKLIWNVLPLVYLESFDELMNLAKKEYKNAFQTKKIFFDYSGISSNEIHKGYLMLMQNTDAVFYGMQHGGGYGIDRAMGLDTEYNICDVFLTWGWDLKGNKSCDFCPLSIHKILSYDTKKIYNPNEILYVGYAHPQFVNNMNTFVVNPDVIQKGEYHFFENLSVELKSKMRVRLYKNSYGWWHTRTDLERAALGLRFDSELKAGENLNENYYNSIMNSKLVVSSVLSTTVLEALAMGKPILCMHVMDCLEENAYDELLKLRKVGVLVETWEELTETLEEIYDCVAEWWDDSERKEVVQEFKNKYVGDVIKGKQLWYKLLVK